MWQPPKPREMVAKAEETEKQATAEAETRVVGAQQGETETAATTASRLFAIRSEAPFWLPPVTAQACAAVQPQRRLVWAEHFISSQTDCNGDQSRPYKHTSTNPQQAARQHTVLNLRPAVYTTGYPVKISNFDSTSGYACQPLSLAASAAPTLVSSIQRGAACFHHFLCLSLFA